MKKLTKSHLEEWMQEFGRAWQEADVTAIPNLFDEDAEFIASPFDAALVGREAIRAYWAQIPYVQSGVQFTSEVFEVRSLTAVVYWQAFYSLVATGEYIEVNGVMEVKFGTAGTCKRLREWWHARPIFPLR